MTAAIRFIEGLDRLGERAWSGLDTGANPLLSYAFLEGLERTGVLRGTGSWSPCHGVLEDAEGVLACCPLYQKTDSHGEFIFDWSWARAYFEHGLDYYPKLLSGVPYSPVTGGRLLVRRGLPADQARETRRRLLQAILQQEQATDCSSTHVNFLPPAECDAFAAPTWLARYDWQFHWHNRDYDDFDDFLARLSAKKRKNIRQERRRVTAAGIRCRRLSGSAIDDASLAFAFACYQHTFLRKGNHPVLNLAFLRHLRDQLGEGLMIVLAERMPDTAGTDERDAADPIAAAIFLQGGGRLYGRYWGAREQVPGLHFEVCYYQGIEHCIQHRLSGFEPGAQGEHKISRGFVPVKTYSYHHIAHPAFADAIRRHLAAEQVWLDSYGQELNEHLPYRQSGSS